MTRLLDSQKLTEFFFFLSFLSPLLSKKSWEIVYMYYVMEQFVDCSEGTKRGLVFAAGQEVTVSYFASQGCHILATDMPPDLAEKSGWKDSGQFAESKERLYQPINNLDVATFNERVSFRTGRYLTSLISHQEMISSEVNTK